MDWYILVEFESLLLQWDCQTLFGCKSVFVDKTHRFEAFEVDQTYNKLNYFDIWSA